MPSSFPADIRPISWLMITSSTTLHVTLDHFRRPPRTIVTEGIHGARIPVTHPENVRDLTKALITASVILTGADIAYHEARVSQGDATPPGPRRADRS